MVNALNGRTNGVRGGACASQPRGSLRVHKIVTSAMRITYLFKREASILRNDLSLVLNVGILGQLDLDAYHGVDLPSARAAIARRAAANADTDDQNDEEDDNDASRDPAVVVVPHGLCSEWRRRWLHGRRHETSATV